ncbi:MAG: carbohydrate porin [Rhodocyclales bacterium]|nr:carbohydrate porin [Rhodocyclales bacterium]
MRFLPTLLAASVAAAFALPAAANDTAALRAELQRLAERIEALEKHNKELEQSLAAERISEQEPEVVTRLKAVEFQTLSMQKQARQIEALDGVTVGASLVGVAQKVSRGGTPSDPETRANYRGDVSVTLPVGSMGDSDGKLFTHVRFGQGTGVALRPTYTSTPNTVGFETNAGPDDSFAILAQAWYQLSVPLSGDGLKANAREHLHFTVGKIDPFVFFDQNVAADDESAKFLNNVFVHNPLLDSGGDIGADAYGFAPGAIVRYENSAEKGSEWAVSLGAFGSGPGANFSGNLADPFVIAQVEKAARINFLPGSYRLYGWTNGRAEGYDGMTRRHSGVGVSVDQKVTDDLTLFARYGHHTADKVAFDRALTVGAELEGTPWGRAADSLGLAFGSLRTSDDYRVDSLAVAGYEAAGSEQSVELYYRYKLNDAVELTPDFQWIRRAGGDGDAAAVKVVGLRAKLGF